MLHNLISNIRAITKGVIAGEIVDNQLNPVYLEIATTGYRIQRTLHIPDRIGFFSSGPPRLQVHQASSFITLVMSVCSSIVSGGISVFLVRVCGLPYSLKLVVTVLRSTVAEVVCLWVLECCDRRRAPGYDWGEWAERGWGLTGGED